MWTRRAFMKAGGLAIFSAGVGGTPEFLLRTAGAAADANGYGRRKVLVSIFQRGAMDGLMAVSPLADQGLIKLRPRLGMSIQSGRENSLIEIEGGYGLHPAFSGFMPLFREGRLAIIHGVGSPDTTRSHFDAQDYMETGTPGRKGTRSGWLNRAIGLLGHEGTPFQAVAMTPTLPRSLYGSKSALAISKLEDFGVKLRGLPGIATAAGESFESLYKETSQELLSDTGQEGFEAAELLSKLNIKNYRPANGAQYPNSPLGQNLREIAMLIKADIGLEIAFAETGGWDTHVQQGTGQGSFARRARDLAQSISAFWADLEKYQDNVALMTMTEFGRTVHENGSGGTDHGRASCMFVLGNQLDGGKIHGTIPALDPDALEDGRDLPVTTDFRSVFAEVAGGHLDITKDDVLFPRWSGRRMSLIR